MFIKIYCIINLIIVLKVLHNSLLFCCPGALVEITLPLFPGQTESQCFRCHTFSITAGIASGVLGLAVNLLYSLQASTWEQANNQFQLKKNLQENGSKLRKLIFGLQLLRVSCPAPYMYFSLKTILFGFQFPGSYGILDVVTQTVLF